MLQSPALNDKRSGTPFFVLLTVATSDRFYCRCMDAIGTCLHCLDRHMNELATSLINTIVLDLYFQ